LLLTAGLTVLLVALCAFVHYEVLRTCNEALPRLQWIPGRALVLIATGAAFCSHVIQMALFAGAYWLLHDTTLGSLHGQAQNTASTFLYFSAETYTSLGFGDVYPIGEMRLIAGIEALTGLLMIGWSASFTYLEMRRHWIAPER
jgi:Ion channel